MQQDLSAEQALKFETALDAAYKYEPQLCEAVKNVKHKYNFAKHDGDWIDMQQLFYLADPHIWFLTDDQNIFQSADGSRRNRRTTPHPRRRESRTFVGEFRGERLRSG